MNVDLKVEFAVGWHKQWEADCRSVPRDKWPDGITKALDVVQTMPHINHM